MTTPDAKSLACAAILFTLAGALGLFCAGQAPTSQRPAGAGSASFQALAARATAASDAGRTSEAQALLRQALALNPKWAEGWWSLGTIAYDNDEYQPAAAAFRHVVALDPKHGTARAMLGLCEFELGQEPAALTDIEASKGLGVEVDPQLRQVVLYHEGILLQRAGKFEAASKAFSSLCLSGVRSDDLAQSFGMTMLHINSHTPPAAGTDAGNVVKHIGRGACLSAAKEYEVARPEYQWVLEQDPHFPLVNYAYGRFLLEARDRPAAIEAFKQQIAEDANNVLARLEIAAVEYKVDSAAGVPFAQQALQIAPQSPFAHYLLGLLLLDTGKYAESIPNLEVAKAAFPHEAKIFWSLGVAYAHAGRLKEAAQARAEFARLNQASAQQDQAPDETPMDRPEMDSRDGTAPGPQH